MKRMKKKTRKRLKNFVVGCMLFVMILPLFNGFMPQQNTGLAADPKLMKAFLESKNSDAVDAEKQSADIEGTYQINKVLNGNTLSVMWGDEERNVKLIGVSVPKIMEEKATAFLEEELTGIDMVDLEFDEKTEDSDGALLAYAYFPEDASTTINGKLLMEGYAKLADEKNNVKHLEDLRSAEKFARDNLLGCWNETEVQEDAQ